MESEKFKKLEYILGSGFSSIIELIKEIDEFNEKDNINFSEVEPWHNLYSLNFDEIVSKVTGVPVKDSHMTLDQRYEISQKMRDPVFWEERLAKLEKSPKTHKPQIANPGPLEESFGSLYCLFKCYECIMIHKTSMQSLFNKIIDGSDPNNEILFKILQIDRTAIYHHLIKPKIIEAIVYNNQDFIKQLSKTLMKSKRKKRRYPELTFAIWYLVENQIYDNLNKEQRIKLLSKYYSPYTEPESFTREIDRIKSSLQT